jgi:hypothetical protein
MKKKCPRCKQEKPKSEFYKSTIRFDRLSTYCKLCDKMAKYKKKDPYAELYGV